MKVFSGNTATTATSSPYNIGARIKSFSLVNKTVGAITVTVSIMLGSTNVVIYSGSIAASGTYTHSGTGYIGLIKEHLIYITVSGSCDYYFTIE